jgi:FixJ family two-component response regulator/anti-sigma regulatory factor (Ser/Thr protein kinase)
LIKFNSCFEPNSSFVFIKVDPSNFNRMISNLINNAVDAFEGKEGEIDLNLSLDDERVNIIIQDNGKGMPQKIVDKIMNNIAVTAGKKDGNGIGLAQVRNTLHISKGKMSIESEIGTGTKITLTFLRVGSPDWIAEEIVLHKGDTVVILDDDNSIHDAWNARFEEYANIIKLKHFEVGEEAIDFINNAAEKNKIFLLSDFELINQEFNGLQIIEKTSMQKQSVLVTSHYHNQPVRDLAAEIGVKILPKQLAPEVPIKIEEKERNKSAINNFKKIELVIIDDDQMLADSLVGLLKERFDGAKAYYHPNHFLKDLSKYAKDTIICMDHDFKTKIDGIELAKQLNEAGYTKLYLLSGKTFEDGEIPDYLTVLLKGDTDALDKLV